MLPKRHRLSRAQVADILSEGSSVRNKYFVFKYHRGDVQDTRISVAVPKKNVPQAVARERTKRRCYAALETLLSKVLIPVHGVVFVHNNLSSYSSEDIEKMLRRLFVRAGILESG